MNRDASDTEARRRAERSGHFAELAASLLLRAKGFRILARRWKGPAGEIDLVARRGRLLVFVEVRRRPTIEEAAFSIGPEKRRRLERAAGAFLVARPALADLDMRFDAILVAPGRLPVHLADAFTASGRY
ncbi:MAG TPA: YraN family protein [Kaistiaceae bacterium]|nr:YraN family protein [Kaistiaceae bacterium]